MYTNETNLGVNDGLYHSKSPDLISNVTHPICMNKISLIECKFGNFFQYWFYLGKCHPYIHSCFCQKEARQGTYAISPWPRNNIIEAIFGRPSTNIWGYFWHYMCWRIIIQWNNVNSHLELGGSFLYIY